MNKKDRIDIVVDIETLGNKPGCAIFQIAALAFNIYTNDEIDCFNQIANIENDDCFLNVSGSTLKWWLNTDKELLTELLNKGTCSSKELIDHFWKWLTNITNEYENVYLWGNGILFDNNILKVAIEDLGLNYPINFRQDRDIRTLIELAALKENISEKEFRNNYSISNNNRHNAFIDCRNEKLWIYNAFKILLDR